ncbi:MAG TPA: metallophosphoesterase [Tepidisphaeraceae bacterium]|jgi:hypothetical protein|nr:metallophosphoesterase [Tepidisphaeraceae bacterium]
MHRLRSKRLQLLVALYFAAFLNHVKSGAIAAEATPLRQRDWKQYPAIADFPEPAMLYALGDVHGDCDRMVELLAAARLISGVPLKPDRIQWAGGSADLVLIGDMIDKYTQSVLVLETLRALEPQVTKAGGHLVLCVGNHEAEFLASGGDSKKSAEFGQELKAIGMSGEDVAARPDAGGLGAWLRNRPVGARIGDWFFCHAGNTGGKTLPQLEAELETDLADKGYATPFLMDPNSMLEARMHPRPWWTGTSDPSLHESKKHLATTAVNSRRVPVPPTLKSDVTALGARHLVIAHQPGKIKFEKGAERKEGEMFERYGGLFFMIDTGMSRGVAGGRGALLQIHTTAAHVVAAAVYGDGKTVILWQDP